MHIDVSHILASVEGARASFNITGEKPNFSDVPLTQPVEGEISLTRTDFGLASSGQARASIELECHRCLSAFSYAALLDLRAEFAPNPEPDQWPILANRTIDLAPLIHQELVLATPIKQLCRPDCLGLCAVCGQRQDQLHHHRNSTIKHQPRITKGK